MMAWTTDGQPSPFLESIDLLSTVFVRQLPLVAMCDGVATLDHLARGRGLILSCLRFASDVTIDRFSRYAKRRCIGAFTSIVLRYAQIFI